MTTMLDETHDPARASWVEGADGHPDFAIALNLKGIPYEQVPHDLRTGEQATRSYADGDPA